MELARPLANSWRNPALANSLVPCDSYLQGLLLPRSFAAQTERPRPMFVSTSSARNNARTNYAYSGLCLME